MNDTPPPEFSRIIRFDQIGRMGDTHIEAHEAERKALERRFRLVSLDRLEALFALAQDGAALIAKGRLLATLEQPCVATGDPVAEIIDAPFTIRFERENDAPGEDETELDETDCDTVFYTGDSIDMGEAVAETLALLMEPYPRAPDADAYLRKMGVATEEQAGPFAALLALKRDSKPDK